VIRRISENLVPAAINLYQARKATDGSREIFLSVQRQKDQYQGVWIISPEARVLGGRHDYVDFKNGAVELLETIDAGLRAFGEVTPRAAGASNPLPHRVWACDPAAESRSLSMDVRCWGAVAKRSPRGPTSAAAPGTGTASTDPTAPP
jgi:hypothetical protein